MITIVIRKLNQRKVFISTTLEVNDTSSNHIFKSLDSTVLLTIRFGVKSVTKLHLLTNPTLERFPKIGR